MWAKEEGSWRDLEICEPKSGGGAEIPFRPPSLESGRGRALPLHPCSYAYVIIRLLQCIQVTIGSTDSTPLRRINYASKLDQAVSATNRAKVFLTMQQGALKDNSAWGQATVGILHLAFIPTLLNLGRRSQNKKKKKSGCCDASNDSAFFLER